MSSTQQLLLTEGGGAAPNYIEDVFSTYLYTGTGTNVDNTITNGIDLSTKGGLVWTKARSSATSHALNDTVRGFSNYLQSQSTNGQNGAGSLVTMTANSDGYTINDTNGSWNGSGTTFASWTFRKQPKFFDIVTYTGNGTAGRTISHNLGSVPGCMIIKCTSTTTDWTTYHVSLGATKYVDLNRTAAADTYSGYFNNTDPTSTVFTVGSHVHVNGSGQTYVAYLFANDAGGFGLTGTDNVISCGSYTGATTGTQINLGWEPQYLLIKCATASSNWFVIDNMRGFQANGNDWFLYPNLSNSEYNDGSDYLRLNSTGFQVGSDGFFQNANVGGTQTFIYMAIRRGPMKVPTDATKVFAPVTGTSVTSPYTVSTGFPVDLIMSRPKSVGYGVTVDDRLRGGTTTSYTFLKTNETTAETTSTGAGLGFQNNTAVIDSSFWSGYGLSPVYWNFQRAPSFFDEVCYTGDGGGAFRLVYHNLTVAPEMLITKARNAGSTNWYVSTAAMGTSGSDAINARFNGTNPSYNDGAFGASIYWYTNAYYTGSNAAATNNSGTTYVSYLFATCAGVSKVGSYTGTGATQTINCGFAGGARFVLVKCIDSNGDWYVWDTARGMVSGTDPSLLLNSTAAEVNANSIYTTTGGFQIVSTAAGINASGGSYIFLAIA